MRSGLGSVKGMYRLWSVEKKKSGLKSCLRSVANMVSRWSGCFLELNRGIDGIHCTTVSEFRPLLAVSRLRMRLLRGRFGIGLLHRNSAHSHDDHNFPHRVLWFFRLRRGGIISNFSHKPTVDVRRSVRLSSFDSLNRISTLLFGSMRMAGDLFRSLILFTKLGRSSSNLFCSETRGCRVHFTRHEAPE